MKRRSRPLRQVAPVSQPAPKRVLGLSLLFLAVAAAATGYGVARRARVAKEEAIRPPQETSVVSAPAPASLEGEMQAHAEPPRAPEPPSENRPAEPPPIAEYDNPEGNVRVTVHQPPTRRTIDHPTLGRVIELKFSDGETLYEPADEVLDLPAGEPMRPQPLAGR